MQPFIKWAGGKTQLLERLIERLPKKYNRYYEPFIGGGALFLKLKNNNSVVNDINSELINVYRQIQQNVDEVIIALAKIDTHHENYSGDLKEYYYEMRKQYNLKIENQEYDNQMASLFIYLNKHCFNGLYRVNSKGFFNVPFNGNKKGNSFDELKLREISNFLNKVEILNVDFEEATNSANKGDLVFFDSPYVPLNETTFETYTAGGFGIREHERLAKLFDSLTKRGVFCILTNHNSTIIHELYSKYKIEIVDVKRMINSKGNGRTGEEVIVTNFDSV